MWYKGVIIQVDPVGWFFVRGDYLHYEREKDVKERVEQILSKVGVLWEIKEGKVYPLPPTKTSRRV